MHLRRGSGKGVYALDALLVPCKASLPLLTDSGPSCSARAQILTRPASSNAGPPPTASEADSQSIANATSDAAGDAPAFPPFRASHFHTDLRLVLGFTAATIMIGATVWAYFIEPEWEKNKGPCGIAVIM